MINAYSIGVTLKLNNLVGPELLSMAAQFEKLDLYVASLAKGLKAISAEALGLKMVAKQAGSLDRQMGLANTQALLLARNMAAISAMKFVPPVIPGVIPGRSPGIMSPSIPGGSGGGSRGSAGGIHGGRIHAGTGGFGIGSVGMGLSMEAIAPILIGAGMMTLLKGPLHEVTEWEKIIASMKQKGLGDAQIADAKKFVTANDIYGTSIIDRAKIFNEAQGSFRESGMMGVAALEAAKTMTPVLTAYKLATATLDEKSQAAAEGSFSSLNKIVELMGGLNDTKRATEIVGGVFKAVQGSGKMVSERDIRQFITQGGSSVSGLSIKTIFGALEPVMGEFGGAAMGTGMNTAYRLLSGTQSKPSKLFVREAIKMGLWDKNNLVFNNEGGIKEYKGHPLKPEVAGLMHDDTLGFVKNLMTIYKENGINTQQDRERENDILLGRTGAKIYNKMMLQLSVMEASQAAFDKAHAPTEVNGEQKNSIMQRSAELHAKYNDMKLQLGFVILPLAIKALQILNPMLKGMAEWMGRNHTAVKFLVFAFTGLATVLAIGGSVLLIAGAISGLGIASALIVGPIGIAVLAIGTIAAACYAFGPLTKKEINEAKWEGGAILSPDAAKRVASGDLQSIGNHDFVRNPSAVPVVVNTNVVLDGRVVATAVNNYNSKTMAAPQAGTGRFDPNRSPTSPGMNVR